MATLSELAALPEDTRWGGFVKQVHAACVKKAAAIASVPDPGAGAEAKAWAQSCLASPANVANQIVFAVIGLVDNASENVTVEQIFTGSEAQIQSYVDQAVDKLYGV